ncbi:hypothetical protein [Sorangium cellulosum]|nr:hypothetical protein [Sorangium cellulosum]
MRMLQRPSSECPQDYPERVVLYRDVEDTRGCEPCTCEPQGATCTANITMFSGSNCDVDLDRFSGVVSEEGACVSAGAAPLAAKTMTAEWIENDPGTGCIPRGGSEEPVGEVKPAEPAVYCCQPLEEE